jgi:hypothetical protein
MAKPTSILIAALAFSAAALTIAQAQPTQPAAQPAAPAAARAPEGPTPQPSRCPDLTPPPALPDSVDTEAAFNAGTDLYNQWRTAMEPVEACRQAEIREMQAQSRQLQATFNARIAEFRATDTAGRETADKWTAVREAFLAKQAPAPRKR